MDIRLRWSLAQFQSRVENHSRHELLTSSGDCFGPFAATAAYDMSDEKGLTAGTASSDCQVNVI